MPILRSVNLERISLPLKKAYVLSHTTLKQFECIFSHVQLDTGQTLIGEVVPLENYTTESLDEILTRVQQWIPVVTGFELEKARNWIAQHTVLYPTSCSLVLSAIDSFYSDQDTKTKLTNPVPLVFPVSSTDPHLEKTIAEGIESGFKTIKVKIGNDIQQDIKAVKKIQSIKNISIRYRFDANQAYSLDEALLLAANVEDQIKDRVELIEQPFPSSDWDTMEKLIQQSSLPYMLDESIWKIDDIDRAARMGCKWIKLKLCKQGGTAELVQWAKHACNLGLQVTVGNGVATDIANWTELMVYDQHRDLFSGASESNGFAKLTKPVHYHSIKIANGCAIS